MFNKKFKLFATMVGVVAVLVTLMIFSSLAQCGPFGPLGPGPCIDRGQIEQGLQAAFSSFTASAEDLLDFEKAVLWSDGTPGLPRLIAYIPPHPVSDFIPLTKQLLAGEKVEVPVGGLWVGDDPTDFLPRGAYKIRLRMRDDKAEMVFINSAGEEVRTSPAKLDKNIPPPEKITFQLTVIISNPSKCWYVKIGPIEGGAHFEWNL